MELGVRVRVWGRDRVRVSVRARVRVRARARVRVRARVSVRHACAHGGDHARGPATRVEGGLSREGLQRQPGGDHLVRVKVRVRVRPPETAGRRPLCGLAQ